MPAASGYIVYKNASIEVDSVEYANQLSRARLVPETPSQTFRTLVPDGVVQDVDSPAWTLELAGLQIWTAGGLVKALHDAAVAGDNVEIVLQPKLGTAQPTATVTIVPKSLPFGGDQGQILPFEDSFQVVGAPVFGTSS
jgi:hypothetical protein